MFFFLCQAFLTREAIHPCRPASTLGCLRVQGSPRRQQVCVPQEPQGEQQAARADSQLSHAVER